METFTQYFYDACASQLFLPISNLPELKDGNSECLGGWQCWLVMF